MQPVSIDVLQSEVIPVSIDINSSRANIMSPEVAQVSAAKAHLGLAQRWDKTEEAIYQALVTGDEDLLRQEAAAIMDDRNAGLKKRILLQNVVNNNQNISPNIIRDLDTLLPPTNPKSVFEKAYASRFMDEFDHFTKREGDTIWSQAYKEIPVYTERMRMLGIAQLASTEFFKKLQTDASDTLKKQGWGSWGVDVAKDVFSLGLYTEYNLRGLSDDTSFFYGLLGSNLHKATRDIAALPHDQMVEKALSIYNPLKEKNPMLALTFATALVGQSVSDEAFDNAVSALNLSVLPSLVKLGAKGAKSLLLAKEVNDSVKQVIKQAANSPPTEAAMAEAVGDLNEAAVKKVSTGVMGDFRGTGQPTKDAIERLPSALRTDVIDIEKAPSFRLGTTASNILRDDYTAFTDKVMSTLASITQIQRIPLKQATEDTLRKLQERTREFYGGLSNAILDVANPVREPFSNTYNYDIAIGNMMGTLFTDAQTAREFAQLHKLPIKNVEATKNGLGYYIRINRPLNETDDIIRDLYITTDIAKTPETGFIRSSLSWLRTPEDTMAQLQRINRKVVTYAQANLRRLADDERRFIEDIKFGTKTPEGYGDLGFVRRLPYTLSNLGRFTRGTVTRTNKTKWDDLERALDNAQKMKNPETGLPGYFFRSIQELEEFYMFAFKRMPDLDEVRGYFAHKRLNELDRAVRTIELYRNKARVGTQSHVVHTSNGSTQAFDGIIKTELPGGDDAILVMGSELGKETLWQNVSAMSKRLQDSLKLQIKKGELQVVEIYDPEQRPLKDFGKKVGGTRVRYIIANNVETNPLSWDQLPRRGGGHFEYEYDFYIKQARIRPEKWGTTFRNWYEGDTTVMPIAFAAQGRDLVDKFNAVRALLASEQVDAAKDLAKRTLPIEWKEFKGWFNKTKDVDGNTIPPRLDVNEPFVVLKKDELIVDQDKGLESRVNTRSPGTFRDGTRQGSAARQFTVKFTGERDAYDVFTINNEGTAKNPIYKYEPAKLVDPIPMMNRALSRVMNTSLMDDYKIFAIEHWIKEAEPLLNASKSELAYAPYKYFYEAGDKKAWKPSANSKHWEKVQLLMSNRQKINQFLGQPSSVDTFIHALTQRVADWTYDKIGPRAAVLPAWLIPKTTDPVSATRGMVYHMKLGLFAVPQLIVQNMTYVSMAALSPRYVTSGVTGALFHKWAEVNPVMLSKLDDFAAKLKMPGMQNWKTGELKEAYDTLGRTGFSHVGGEYVNLDAISNYKVVTSGKQMFLDWGQGFFKAGERSVRLGAWYTAFKEFRAANPTGRITDSDIAKILDRADLLTTNMSRASASAMHSGVFSLTSQFLSYQIRLAELFFSKRLGETVAERSLARARIMTVYSAMFGIPSAIGVTGIPLGDYIKQKAVEQGYVVGDNWVTSLMVEGLPAILAAMATGGGDIKKGNVYNFGDRFGSQGFEQVKEVFRGDKPWWHIAGGAAFSTFSNIFSGSDGMMQAAHSMIRGDGLFKLRPEDLIDPLREIQSVNIAEHVRAVINTGHWMSKKGHDLGKTSPLNGVFMAALGLQNQSVEDAFIKGVSLKDRQNDAKKAETKFIEEYRRGLIAGDQQNYEQSIDHLKRSIAWLIAYGYPQEDWPKLFAQASDRHQNLIQRINWKFYEDSVPEQMKTTLRDARTRQLSIEQGRQ